MDAQQRAHLLVAFASVFINMLAPAPGLQDRLLRSCALAAACCSACNASALARSAKYLTRNASRRSRRIARLASSTAVSFSAWAGSANPQRSCRSSALLDFVKREIARQRLELVFGQDTAFGSGGRSGYTTAREQSLEADFRRPIRTRTPRPAEAAGPRPLRVAARPTRRSRSSATWFHATRSAAARASRVREVLLPRIVAPVVFQVLALCVGQLGRLW